MKALKELRASKPIIHHMITNWQEVIWKKIKLMIIDFLKEVVESLLADEITRKIGANKYERNSKRKGYRNGYYSRSLETIYGKLEDLQVPRTYEPIEFMLFDKYQRRRQEIDFALGTLFVNGISTRKLKYIYKDLYGMEISPQLVSKINTIHDNKVKEFQNRQLSDDIEFLFLDGITQKTREIYLEQKTMLCALGIKKDGTKEILSFRLVDIEDSNNWEAFLVDLKSRGLLGKNLRLITTDGHPGLLRALKKIYPFIKIQRCMVHKLRNVAVKLKRSQKKACMKGAKLIFAADTQKEAIARFKKWKSEWIITAESAVRCMEKDLEACLVYYDFEPQLWTKIRTTNILERAFREVRRRTRPMGVFVNDESVNRIMYAIADGLNKGWRKSLKLISTN